MTEHQNAAPALSVILPSRNGARSLPRALAAQAALAPPPGGAELILIDNGSTDTTPALFAAHGRAHPNVTVLTETTPGKSSALNTGIAAARGALLVFTDDDTLPAPDWLLAYAAAADAQPEIALFGGSTRPHWDRPPARWMEEAARQGRLAAASPVDAPAGPITPDRIKGLNFAVRRSAMGEIRFDTGALNYTGNGGGGSEDVAFAAAIADAGGALAFLPEAALGHIVRADEMRFRALLSRQHRLGRSSTEASIARGDRVEIPGMAKPVRQIFVGLLQYGLGRPNRGARAWMSAAFSLGIRAGAGGP